MRNVAMGIVQNGVDLDRENKEAGRRKGWEMNWRRGFIALGHFADRLIDFDGVMCLYRVLIKFPNQSVRNV